MDRDIFLFEKMGEIYDNKISFMIESLDNQLKINMLEAQYKVVTESGTKEDFEYLYMEAQEETKKKKKGIFNGIIEWVKKIKDRLVDFFTKKKIEKKINELPDKVEVDKAQDEQYKGFKKFHDWLVKPINLFKQKKYKDLTVDIIKKGAGIVGVVTGIAALNIHMSLNKSEIKERTNWILKVFKTDCDSVLKMLNVNDDDLLPIKILKQCISFINTIITEAMKWCTRIATSTPIGEKAGKEMIKGELRHKAYKIHSGLIDEDIAQKKHDDAVQWVSKPVFNKDGYVNHDYHVEELVDKRDLMDLKEKRAFDKKWSDEAKKQKKAVKKELRKTIK